MPLIDYKPVRLANPLSLTQVIIHNKNAAPYIRIRLQAE
jgi:hypothetical protein